MAITEHELRDEIRNAAQILELAEIIYRSGNRKQAAATIYQAAAYLGDVIRDAEIYARSSRPDEKTYETKQTELEFSMA